jgi:hypothetical protein
MGISAGARLVAARLALQKETSVLERRLLAVNNQMVKFGGSK